MTNFVEDALKSKHELLRACTASRDLALRQLFESTVAYLQINNIDSDNGGVTAFLEANDISKDRFFDPSTLPSIDDTNLPEFAIAQSVDTKQRLQRSLKVVEDTRHGTHTFLTDKQNGEGGQERSLQVSTPATVLSQQTSKLPQLPDSGTIEGSYEFYPSEAAKQAKDSRLNPLKSVHEEPDEPTIRTPRALPLSTDDVVSMDEPAFPSREPEQEPGGARIVHLPHKEVQEQYWESGGQARTGKDEILERSPQPYQDNNGLTPPNSGRNTYTSPDKKENASASENEHDNILKSQMRISRAEAFAEAPSTPDQQLRLEEAQSMKLSGAPGSIYPTQDGISRVSESMQAPTTLPSQFVHGDLDNGESMIDMSKPESLARAELEGQINSIARPTPGLRDHMYPGMNGEASKDLTFSRRPPMRIDTGVPSASDPSKSFGASRTAATIATTATTNIAQSPAESATPNRSAILASSAQSPPERMTTRVSSGALRHKSVSEILGEIPKATAVQPDRSSQDAHKEDAGALQTPKSASSFTSPDPAVFKQRLTEIANRERSSKLSTVVFAKQQPTSISRSSDIAHTQDLAVEETPIENRDYLLTLFAAQVSTTHKAQSLNTLLKSAHKTLNTSDHYTDFRERQDCRILNKIYEMQATNKWSLRQLERSVEPNRPVSHLDVMLGQMKWMRTDFREERKWKIAAAKYLAEACERWVASSAEGRKSLQVKVRRVLPKSECAEQSASTPDLVHSAGGDLSEATDDDFVDNTERDAPAAIFSLPPDMFIFGLNKSPVAEKLLLELPLYQPHVEVQDAALHVTEFAPDAIWKKPIVPLSKYAQGKIVLRENGPPRKRSRHNYSDNDESQSESPFEYFEHLQDAAHPEKEDVALFNPENKHIRDRIHAGHAFRPPSEHIMPSQHFFECRQPSQWTKEEDDELRRLVREYAYNWSLISTCLATPSIFSSGAERRTPWECFERWITLEGLPAEVSKINYFRAYNARLQAAARSYEGHQQALLQQSGNNAAQMPSRRRSTQPFSVDRRKNAKHIHLIDAMRKQAKKRETTLHKQQHVASLAAMRKATEPPKARQTMHTPQEFSRLKHERQMKTEEVMRNNRLQWLQQQRANQAQRSGQQNGQQPYGLPPNRNVPPSAPNGGSPSTASPVPQARGGTAEQPRGTPSNQRPINGQSNGVLPTNAQGVPHAPMQPHVQLQMSQRVPPHMAAENMRVYQEATRLQAEQQAYLQRQRQQQQPQSNIPAGSPNMQNPSALPQNNSNMLASMQGRASPSANGGPPPIGSSASPSMTQPQSLSSGMTPAVNQISNAIKLRNPQASPEQLRNMTNEQLYLQTQQQAARQATQAAAGNPNPGAMIGNGNIGMQAHSPMQQHAIMANGASPMLNPQQYAHMMRTQQASQQRGGSAGAVGGMNGSRSATPLVQRTGSAQGGRGPSQSPRAGQVGKAGVQ